MRWITGLFGFLWRVARGSWVNVGGGLRPHSMASALYLFLFFVFFVVGAILWALGFDLGEVERWMDAHAGLFDWVGTWLWRLFCGFVLLICAFVLVFGAYDRLSPGQRAARGRIALSNKWRRKSKSEQDAAKPIGCIGFGMALLIGWFAWVGMTMPQ